MKLDSNNYYTTENKYISNSKMSDYLYDPFYFYQRHVTGEVKPKITDSMIIGKAVDMWLTGSEEMFRDSYVHVIRRKKIGEVSEKEYEYQLTKTMMDEVEKICRTVEGLTFYKDIKDYIRQEILFLDQPKGQFRGLCGIPDFYNIENKICTIVDLKTSRTISPRSYHYHCYEYGYFRQQAIYQTLLAEKYDIEKFKSLHLVVEKNNDRLNRCQLFQLNQEAIGHEKEDFWSIYDVMSRMDFKKQDITWEDIVTI